jgi:hypothetical protein
VLDARSAQCRAPNAVFSEVNLINLLKVVKEISKSKFMQFKKVLLVQEISNRLFFYITHNKAVHFKTNAHLNLNFMKERGKGKREKSERGGGGEGNKDLKSSLKRGEEERERERE